MSPPSRSSSFHAHSQPVNADLAIRTHLYSRSFLFLFNFSAQLLLHLNNGPPTNKSEKNARGVVVGVGRKQKQEKGALALKLAYLKWAVKKPATHPSQLARARAESCSLKGRTLNRGDGETMTYCT